MGIYSDDVSVNSGL